MGVGGGVEEVGEGVCAPVGILKYRDGCARLGSAHLILGFEMSVVLCLSVSLEGKVLALYKYPTLHSLNFT